LSQELPPSPFPCIFFYYIFIYFLFFFFIDSSEKKKKKKILVTTPTSSFKNAILNPLKTPSNLFRPFRKARSSPQLKKFSTTKDLNSSDSLETSHTSFEENLISFSPEKSFFFFIFSISSSHFFSKTI